MTVSLWEIAQHAASQRIELFGEQTHVIAAGNQTLKQFSGFRMTPLQDVIVDKPKAARHKRAFTFRQTISGIFDFIAQNKFSIDEQLVLDRPKRSLDSWIACGKKPHERDQQQTGIEPPGAVGLHEAVKRAVETALADFSVDFVGDLAPPLL